MIFCLSRAGRKHINTVKYSSMADSNCLWENAIRCLSFWTDYKSLLSQMLKNAGITASHLRPQMGSIKDPQPQLYSIQNAIPWPRRIVSHCNTQGPAEISFPLLVLPITGPPSSACSQQDVLEYSFQASKSLCFHGWVQLPFCKLLERTAFHLTKWSESS